MIVGGTISTSSFVNSHTTVSHAPIVRSDPLNAVAFPVHVSPVCVYPARATSDKS